MGVSGSGKTTVGQALARALQWPFYEGDSFQPPDNVAKMAAGVPLTDQDRAPWLAALAAVIADAIRRGEGGVMACSALKKSYRRTLRAAAADGQQVVFVWLKGSYETILARMQRRQGHFMQANMLQSQFATLEEPCSAIIVDVSSPLEAQVQQILAALR